VRAAVSADYPTLLRDFLKRRNSWISRLQAQADHRPCFPGAMQRVALLRRTGTYWW
jgi:hypothetical protein